MESVAGVGASKQVMEQNIRNMQEHAAKNANILLPDEGGGSGRRALPQTPEKLSPRLRTDADDRREGTEAGRRPGGAENWWFVDDLIQPNSLHTKPPPQVFVSVCIRVCCACVFVSVLELL